MLTASWPIIMEPIIEPPPTGESTASTGLRPAPTPTPTPTPTSSLVAYGCVVGLHLGQIAKADELPTNDPLALLIGMVLDQQSPERTNMSFATTKCPLVLRPACL